MQIYPKNIKQGDLLPALEVNLPMGEVHGAATVDIILKSSKVGMTLSATSRNNGTWEHVWQEGETLPIAQYKVEAIATWEDGRERTWPEKGFVTFQVTPDLDLTDVPVIVLPGENSYPVRSTGLPDDQDSLVWDADDHVWRPMPLLAMTEHAIEEIEQRVEEIELTPGPQGEQGIQGVAGPKGDKGDVGNTGAQGTKGDTGEQGVPGAKGDTGSQGPKGDTGAAGADGQNGTKGDQGERGPQGEQGIQGVPGQTGPQGPDGQGTVGAQGPKGDKGDQGDAGATGAQGIQGVPGAKGDAGTNGTNGAQGPKGDQGVQGLQGPKGDTGNTGAQGPKGDTGSQGVQGVQGDTGAPGSTGAQGTQGVQGARGVSTWNIVAGIATISQVNGSSVGDYFLNSSTSNIAILGVTNVVPGGMVRSTAANAAALVTGANLKGIKGAGIYAATAAISNISSVAGSAIGDYFFNATTGNLTILGVTATPGDLVQATSATAGTLTGNIRGPQGPQGTIGATGATGTPGATGSTGATGAKGDTGNTGATGATGAKGEKGISAGGGVIWDDDFERANINPAPGGDYTPSSSSGAPSIENGRYVSTGNTYLQKTFANERVGTLATEVSFEEVRPAKTGKGGGALIISKQAPFAVGNDFLHMTFSYDGYYLTIWEGATYDSAILGPVTAQQTLPTPLEVDGRKHRIAMTVSHDEVTVQFGPYAFKHKDPRLLRILNTPGQTVVWQAGDDANNRYKMRYDSAQVTAAPYNSFVSSGRPDANQAGFVAHRGFAGFPSVYGPPQNAGNFLFLTKFVSPKTMLAKSLSFSCAAAGTANDPVAAAIFKDKGNGTQITRIGYATPKAGLLSSIGVKKLPFDVPAQLYSGETYFYGIVTSNLYEATPPQFGIMTTADPSYIESDSFGQGPKTSHFMYTIPPTMDPSTAAYADMNYTGLAPWVYPFLAVIRSDS